MKKWMYVISVSVMLAIFVALWLSEKHKVEDRERARIAKEQADRKIEDEKKAKAEAAARADAARRTAEREAEEAKKEAEKVAKFQEEGRKIQEATDRYNTEANAAAKKAADLEIQLSALRASKEKLSRETFDLAKAVERGKVDRRTAELEIQRTVTMVTQKAEQSALTRMPPPAPTKPAS